ncbi:YebC/PmpR family DNA-binding transcriptional regulator [Anaeromyxobacter paludicola]|uniref:Probable transcriptional regulatory protein AMPC_21650 n=1 Tax=Anaeromyxobacter paludicola TaxID=2918171 RepID=A0ABN6NAT1_9BACT|nr:YebC/PmpR family DNA-binding transcriptional regulator [Anaeromyxobacter paludicola]BDG09052.1 putative transcriptional regulatory protein [Anaeromyxobacter paludicola]
MSGHNRWSKIKRKKEAAGSAKGKLFSKVIKEITVAARMGGGDPAGNARLRAAMDAAKEANMPADNITRAVKKGTGELEGVSYEEAMYEGYGPGGVALMVECLTDNRNRTAGDVRSSFAKGGGNLAAEGAVAWMFEKRGVIEVKPGPSEDQVMEAAIEAGAEDVVNQGAEGFEVRTQPNDLHPVAAALEKGFKLGARRVAWIPKDPVAVQDPDKARGILKLMDMLEELDDVQNVHANFEIDDKLLEQLA